MGLAVDEPELPVYDAESLKKKRTELERELYTIDAALERWRVDRAIADEAAGSHDDAELVARHAELMARFDATEAQLLALPTSGDPPHDRLDVDDSAQLIEIATFGRVVAPRAITSADLILSVAPRLTWPCDRVRLCLELISDPHASQSAEELEVALSAAAAATHVDVSLEAPGAALLSLQANISVDIPGRCVVFSFVIPATAQVGASVLFSPVVVSGQKVGGMLGALFVKVGARGGCQISNVWVFAATILLQPSTPSLVLCSPVTLPSRRPRS